MIRPIWRINGRCWHRGCKIHRVPYLLLIDIFVYRHFRQGTLENIYSAYTHNESKSRYRHRSNIHMLPWQYLKVSLQNTFLQNTFLTQVTGQYTMSSLVARTYADLLSTEHEFQNVVGKKAGILSRPQRVMSQNKLANWLVRYLIFIQQNTTLMNHISLRLCSNHLGLYFMANVHV